MGGKATSTLLVHYYFKTEATMCGSECFSVFIVNPCQLAVVMFIL